MNERVSSNLCCVVAFLALTGARLTETALPGRADVLTRAREALGADELAAGGDWLLVFADHSLVGPLTLYVDGSGRVSQSFVGPDGPETFGFDGESSWHQPEHGSRFRTPASEGAARTLGLWLATGAWLFEGTPVQVGEPRSVGAVDVIPVAFRGVTGTVRVDRESGLPESASWGNGDEASSARFRDWTSEGGVRVPREVEVSVHGAPDSVIRVRAVRRFDARPDSFLPDYLSYADTTFDPSAPRDLTLRAARTGHLLVQARIGSREPAWFIFDTGASLNTISTPYARDVGARLVRETSVQGSSGSAPAQVWAIESLTVGPVTLDRPILVGTDLTFLETPFGVSVAGIVGTPTLARVVAEIDLSVPAIAFHDPRAFVGGSIPWEPLILSSTMPTLPASFEGRAGRFIVDLGSARTGIFYRPATDRLGLLDGRETRASGGRGVGGENEMLAAELTSFELGGARYESTEFFFSRATAGFWAESQATGNLGQELLRDFVLVLDYPRQRYSLQHLDAGR